MNAEKQIIAIAEACGWTQIQNCNTMAISGIWRGYPPTGAIIGQKALLPNYLFDLNATHEAEKILNENQREYYWNLLLREVDPPDESDDSSRWLCAHANADHRARALLKTIGKWEE